ncbi:AMP-binding protein, partial [Pseudomonas sp. NPDC088885]|uniref:AMP-binding protein n=1 Tax=Pseudomonas sp. NPDC088885 TaxID=3364457 RepID=UPI0037F93F59
MNEDFWKDKYPAGIAADINPDEYPNIQAVLKQSCQRFANKPAFSNLGKTITYGELYELSGAFAAYLQQHTDLQPGDRIAVQLPNVLHAAHVARVLHERPALLRYGLHAARELRGL